MGRQSIRMASALLRVPSLRLAAFRSAAQVWQMVFLEHDVSSFWCDSSLFRHARSPTRSESGHRLHGSGAGYLPRRVPWAARVPGLCTFWQRSLCCLVPRRVCWLTCTLVQGQRIQTSARTYIARVGVSGPFCTVRVRIATG